MAITFKDFGWGSGPIFVCDWCGAEICEVDEGNVYWSPEDPSTLLFNHKYCAAEHDNAIGGRVMYAEHLEVFLAQLLGNAGREAAMPLVDTNRLYEARGR